MQEVSRNNFGLLIAYLLPGFIGLWALRPFSPTVDSWFLGPSGDAPTVGGFLFLTLGSVGSGMLLSTARWAIIDTLYHHTGIPPPRWDFARLSANLAAYDMLIEIHYRYYQANANALLAVLVLLGSRVATGTATAGVLVNGAFVAVIVLLVLGSRDALARYYSRVSAFL